MNIESAVKQAKNIVSSFEVEYEVDYILNSLFKSLPEDFDYSLAKEEWQWQPKITSVKKLMQAYIMMISNLSEADISLIKFNKTTNNKTK